MKLLLPSSVQKELDALDDQTVLRISDKISQLAHNPYIQGSQKLAGGKGYRIRIGNYRVVYTIDKKQKEILIIKIAHRRESYR